MVELVGVAGVGKSHLKMQLAVHLRGRYVDVMATRPSLRNAHLLAAATRRLAPLFRYVMLSSLKNLLPRLNYCLQLLRYAWREELAWRASPQPEFIVSDEGWFHKLRRIRRFLRPDLAYLDLPASVRRRLFRPDIVVFVTADEYVICARKLRRKGEDVTPEALAAQHARSGALGQWGERELTTRDLEQAAASDGLRYVEIDYRDDFDVASELLPILEESLMLRDGSQRATAPSP